MKIIKKILIILVSFTTIPFITAFLLSSFYMDSLEELTAIFTSVLFLSILISFVLSIIPYIKRQNNYKVILFVYTLLIILITLFGF